MRLPENLKKMRDLLKEDFDDYIACWCRRAALLWASCKYE